MQINFQHDPNRDSTHAKVQYQGREYEVLVTGFEVYTSTRTLNELITDKVLEMAHAL